MKFFSLIFLVILCFGSKSVTPAQQHETPLTNSAVIKLVRAGFKEKTVISIVRSRPNRFTLDPDRLIELKRNGVSENIILAMLAQDGSFEVSDDDWPDDFNLSKRRTSATDQREQGGVDIFGNKEGSKGQTRSRGASGANDGETTTTGTATVRILRPSEPGGVAAKLERTPTLDNEAVIKLVEAGFSEGTIVKRIEDSPAEFDLSSARIDELRKRRVSEIVIAAMRAAMSDEPPGQLKPAKAGNN
ncbi:MAG TPA: hypothetical protein VNO50_14575 [Pyrinomonadaceae bacterium]|nr:hypothetical protein [Pyrinomonadaceae bacterium]